MDAESDRSGLISPVLRILRRYFTRHLPEVQLELIKAEPQLNLLFASQLITQSGRATHFPDSVLNTVPNPEQNEGPVPAAERSTAADDSAGDR